MKARIVLIEDDYFVTEWIRRLVLNHFGQAAELQVVRSETEFLAEKGSLLGEPAAVIVDLTLPWGAASGVDPTSLAGGEPRGLIFQAGLRIIEDIHNHSARASEISVLLYTVSDLPEPKQWPGLRVQYMRKDEPDANLIAWIAAALGIARPQQ